MYQIGRADATGSSNTLEFINIPGTYTDLYIKYLFRSVRNVFYVDGNYFRVNGNAANYSWRRLWNTASTDGSGTSMSFGLINANSTTANSFTIGEMQIPNYASNAPKIFSYDSLTETNTTTDGYYMMVYSGLWNDTAAINSIAFTLGTSDNFAVGSFIELYGITKGSDGATAVA
jgi:hypothetical protein